MQWFTRCGLAFLFITMGAACTRLEPPEERGELVVGIRVSPAYFQKDDGTGGASGFENDLVHLFARELGTKLRFVVARNDAKLIKLVKDGKVHMAAGAPLASIDGVRYSSPLRESGQVLVQHIDAPLMDKVAELEGKTIEVRAASPQADMLRAMNGAKHFDVVELQDMTEIDLLERVNQRKSQLAATDLTHFNIALNYFPDLQLAQELPGSTHFGWAFAADVQSKLFDRAQAFIARTREDGTLARLHDRYLSPIRRINRVGISTFLKRVATVLPHYRREFVMAQQLTGLDWRLLAALSYQESAWDPLATSPTGVRGMMMLTEDTADYLHVTNRLDVRQSIHAGARYLSDIIEQMPSSTHKPDRIWLALSAYNLGQGHLNAARAIALSLKRDPDSWYEMKKVLPLLSRPQYYNRLKSGRGRGGEAVIMVENIRTYYGILTRLEPAVKPQFLSADDGVLPPSGGRSSLLPSM